MDRKSYPVRVVRKGDEDDPYLKNTTAEERLLMMWPLTVQAWATITDRHTKHAMQR